MKKNILVVLDLNGTILHRIKKSSKQTKTFIATGEPDFEVPRNKVYMRPLVAEFFAFLSCRFHVAVWTSAMTHNSTLLVEKMKSDFGAPDFRFIWSQDKCKIIPSYKKPKFRKELEKIQLEFSEFDLSNTVLVDDSFEKWQDTPLNGIPIRTFDISVNIRDRELEYTMEYLQTLYDSYPTLNVPQFIDKNKYRSNTEANLVDERNK